MFTMWICDDELNEELQRQIENLFYSKLLKGKKHINIKFLQRAYEAISTLKDEKGIVPDVAIIDIDFRHTPEEENCFGKNVFVNHSSDKYSSSTRDSAPLGWLIAATIKELGVIYNKDPYILIYTGKDSVVSALDLAIKSPIYEVDGKRISPYIDVICTKGSSTRQEFGDDIINRMNATLDMLAQRALKSIQIDSKLILELWEISSNDSVVNRVDLISKYKTLDESAFDALLELFPLYVTKIYGASDPKKQIAFLLSKLSSIDYCWHLCKAFKTIRNLDRTVFANACHSISVHESILSEYIEMNSGLPKNTTQRIRSQGRYYHCKRGFGMYQGPYHAFTEGYDSDLKLNWENSLFYNVQKISDYFNRKYSTELNYICQGDAASVNLLLDWQYFFGKDGVLNKLFEETYKYGCLEKISFMANKTPGTNEIYFIINIPMQSHLNTINGFQGETARILERFAYWGKSYYKYSYYQDSHGSEGIPILIKKYIYPKNIQTEPLSTQVMMDIPILQITWIIYNYLGERAN